MITIRNQVLAQLEHGPMTVSELYTALPEIEDEKRLGNCLYNLKKAGRVYQDDQRRYALGKGQGEAAPSLLRGQLPRIPAKSVATSTSEPAAGIDRMTQAIAKGLVRPAAEVADDIDRTSFGAAARAPRAILEKAATETQDALDEYLASVADPKILKPLRAARDATRSALDAFDAIGAWPA